MRKQHMYRSAHISVQPDQHTCSLLSEIYLSCQISQGFMAPTAPDRKTLNPDTCSILYSYFMHV